MTTWNVKHTKTQDFEQGNTAWDIWLSPIDEPNPSYPGVEIMIWINHVAQYPIGSKTETVDMWGAQWDLWRGTMSSGGHTWDVFSFVKKYDTWSINNQNIYDFIGYLWKKNWVDGRRYIIGIEAGNEIMDGAGTYTYDYHLSVDGK